MMLVVPLEYAYTVSGALASGFASGVRGGVVDLEEHVGRVGEHAVALLEFEAAAHAQELVEGDVLAGVAGPLVEGGGRLDVELAAADEHADERAGDALGHRPAEQAGGLVEARGVALGDDRSVVHDDDRPRAPQRLRVRLVEGRRDGRVERGAVEAGGSGRRPSPSPAGQSIADAGACAGSKPSVCSAAGSASIASTQPRPGRYTATRGASPSTVAVTRCAARSTVNEAYHCFARSSAATGPGSRPATSTAEQAVRAA
jgi:hypothetical protein